MESGPAPTPIITFASVRRPLNDDGAPLTTHPGEAEGGIVDDDAGDDCHRRVTLVDPEEEAAERKRDRHDLRIADQIE